MPSIRRDPNCAAKGCAKLRERFSRYCPYHKRKLAFHGHPQMSRVSERLYKRHRERITRGLLRYAHSRPMIAAVQLADELLNFRPECGFTYERQIAERMRLARESGVCPMDILRAVAEFQAVLDESPQRFPDGRAERYALARRVLLLGPSWGRWRPRAKVLNNLGGMLKDALTGWAWAFLRKLDQDAEARRDLRRKAADFDGQESAP